jgi:hypothetical protein
VNKGVLMYDMKVCKPEAATKGFAMSVMHLNYLVSKAV